MPLPILQLLILSMLILLPMKPLMLIILLLPLLSMLLMVLAVVDTADPDVIAVVSDSYDVDSFVADSVADPIADSVFSFAVNSLSIIRKDDIGRGCLINPSFVQRKRRISVLKKRGMFVLVVSRIIGWKGEITV